jgi:hypothetical protein
MSVPFYRGGAEMRQDPLKPLFSARTMRRLTCINEAHGGGQLPGCPAVHPVQRPRGCIARNFPHTNDQVTIRAKSP